MLVEYWAHEASLLPVDDRPLLLSGAKRPGWWQHYAALANREPQLVQDLLGGGEGAGPVGAGTLETALRAGAAVPRAKGVSWWERSDVKRLCEWLFGTGRLTTGARVHFQRLYDLPERVLPPEVLARHPADPEASARELVLRAAGALGVATEPDLRDYYRLGPAQSQRAVAELVEDGRARAGGGARLATPRVPAARRADAAAGLRAGVAVSVRPADLGARPYGADLRVPLPHRDLRAGAAAGVRLLRVPVPARRRAGRPGRRQGGPGGGRPAGAGRLRRAGRRDAPGRCRAGRRPAGDGRLAGPGRRRGRRAGRPGRPARRPLCTTGPCGEPSGRRRRPRDQHVPARVRPRSRSPGSRGGVVCRTSSSLRARPDPDDRSSSATTPAWTPIRSPPEPVVSSTRPARASATCTAPVPVRTPTSAATSPRVTSPLPALTSVVPPSDATRTAPEPVRIRARPVTAPTATSPEPVVISASPSTSPVRAVPAPVRTVARPARPCTVTSPAPVRAVTREPAGAHTVTTSGTIRSGSSVLERTVSPSGSPSDQLISAARTASAPPEPASGTASGPEPTAPSHEATSPSRCAHPPVAAGSWRTSTRTCRSAGRRRPPVRRRRSASRPPGPPGARPPARRRPSRRAPPGRSPPGSPAGRRRPAARRPSTRSSSRSALHPAAEVPAVFAGRPGRPRRHPRPRGPAAGPGRTARPAPPAPPTSSAIRPAPGRPARPGP